MDFLEKIPLSEKKLTCPLYKDKNNQIYYSDFFNALKTAGINNNDIVFVHSDISVFGKLCNFGRNFLFDTLIGAIKEAVGIGGTILMPTFSYSFCNNEKFDVHNTKSTVGVLTEHFRNQPDVKRTIHPIFSISIWGKYQKKFLDIGKDSFGKKSVFYKLHKMNGKIIFFGASFGSCTYIHYIEQTHGIPYRYLKTFRGKIRDYDREYDDECTYFVRYLNKTIITDLSRFERHLLMKGLMEEVKVGTGKILIVDADVLFKEGYKLLDKDIYFFLKETPK
jgi:aminoglycoside 3-N-acetyltransferase